MSRLSKITTVLSAALLAWAPGARAQSPVPQPGQQVNIAAQVAAQREAAASSLVPLLRDVRRKASGQVTVGPGSVPNSPFTGTQTTLFAFSVGKKSDPVDAEVIKAIDRLLAWKIEDPNATTDVELFDEWMGQLMVRASALGVQAGTTIGCDSTCVVQRMTKLGDEWGGTARTRPEARDQLMLDALVATVSERK